MIRWKQHFLRKILGLEVILKECAFVVENIISSFYGGSVSKINKSKSYLLSFQAVGEVFLRSLKFIPSHLELPNKRMLSWSQNLEIGKLVVNPSVSVYPG